MKILKLLNRKYFLKLLFFYLLANVYAENQPVDIWNIDKEIIDSNSNSESLIDEKMTKKGVKIFIICSKKKKIQLKQEETLNSKKVKITGLYDPDDYGLDINMWSNSDGDQLKNIF